MGSPCHEEKRDDYVHCELCSAGYLQMTYNFGIELPEVVEEAVAIDKKNRNIFWQDAIEKEIKK